MGAFLAFLLQALVMAAWILILGRILMSWLDPTSSRPIGRFLYSVTEPVLAPIRNTLPKTGSFDLAPLVVLVVLSLLLRLLAR